MSSQNSSQQPPTQGRFDVLSLTQRNAKKHTGLPVYLPLGRTAHPSFILLAATLLTCDIEATTPASPAPGDTV